jgi:type II secretory pathway pseudopilin PulG
MIITITVLGIISSIVIGQFGGTYEGTRATLARQKLELLNRGVINHQQCNGKDNLENLLAANAAAWDEEKVLKQLRYRHPSEPTPGSPYIPPTYRPGNSSSTADYRIAWTGVCFRLIKPGTSGTGIKVVFDGTDMRDPEPLDPNYSWSSR